MKITMQVQELAAVLQATRSSGEEFAQEIFNILTQDWGADKDKIDRNGLNDMGTGHFIDCFIKDVPLGNPAIFIANLLAAYSDIGLAKKGLTREQYNQVLRRIRE